VSESRKTLLFLTTDVPYPADSGGRLKSFKLLERLSKDYEVKLLCAYGGERQKDVKALRNVVDIASIQAFQNHLPRTPFHFLNAIMTSPSFNAYRIYSKELETMVKWSSEAADIALLDHLEMVHVLPEKLDTPIVYHSHNAEYILWEEYARIKGNFLTSWLFEWESDRVKLLERYAMRRARFTFAAPNDAEKLKQIPGTEKVELRNTYHLGMDELIELPDINLESNPQNVFYAGTLNWEPNRDGLQWFIQKCWPGIRAKHPQAEFHVCGKGGDQSLKTIMGHTEGVTYHGFVKDLESIMSKSRCAVVPLRMGSGMKIKTFDALYRGLPLVTTNAGAEGIQIENKTHAWVVNDSDSFIKAVNSTLHDTKTSTTMRDNARQLCKEQYRYSELLDVMAQDIRAIN